MSSDIELAIVLVPDLYSDLRIVQSLLFFNMSSNRTELNPKHRSIYGNTTVLFHLRKVVTTRNDHALAGSATNRDMRLRKIAVLYDQPE